MAKYTPETLNILSKNIKANDKIINQALALSINKTVTFSKDLSVKFITQDVNLSPSYTRSKLKTAKRANPVNLVGIVRANTRETLLTRYPTQETKDGVRVAINKSTGFKMIKRAFRVTNLKGSSASGVAMKNRDVVNAFRAALSPATPGKRRKLQRLIHNARVNPRGITVLHSRSINQLFTSVRVDVQPRSFRYAAEEFIMDVFRLQAKNNG